MDNTILLLGIFKNYWAGLKVLSYLEIYERIVN